MLSVRLKMLCVQYYERALHECLARGAGHEPHMLRVSCAFFFLALRISMAADGVYSERVQGVFIGFALISRLLTFVQFHTHFMEHGTMKVSGWD